MRFLFVVGPISKGGDHRAAIPNLGSMSRTGCQQARPLLFRFRLSFEKTAGADDIFELFSEIGGRNEAGKRCIWFSDRGGVGRFVTEGMVGRFQRRQWRSQVQRMHVGIDRDPTRMLLLSSRPIPV